MSTPATCAHGCPAGSVCLNCGELASLRSRIATLEVQNEEFKDANDAWVKRHVARDAQRDALIARAEAAERRLREAEGLLRDAYDTPGGGRGCWPKDHCGRCWKCAVRAFLAAPLVEPGEVESKPKETR